MKNKLLIVFVFFLGLIFINPKIFVNGADTGEIANPVNSVSEIADGFYTLRLITSSDIPDGQNWFNGESYYVVYGFERSFPYYYIKSSLIDVSKIYSLSWYDYLFNEIVNLNDSIDFNILPDGIYVNEKGTNIVYDLKREFSFRVNNFKDDNSFYVLDYSLNGNILKKYNLLLISDGSSIDVSDGLILFNSISSYYELYRKNEILETCYVNVTNGFVNFNLELSNQIDMLNDYIVFDSVENFYFSVDKIYMDDLIIDLIYKKFGYLIYSPTIIDILEVAKNGISKDIKSGFEIDNSDLYGLYLLSDDSIFKIFDYKEKQFIPFLKKSDFDLSNINIDYSFKGSYSVDLSLFKKFYNLELSDNGIVCFVDNVQVDISNLTFEDLLFIFYYGNSFDLLSFDNYFLNFSYNNSTRLKKYKSLSNGFVRIKDNVFYFLEKDGQVYYVSNISKNDKLKYNYDDYNIIYDYDDNHLLLTFYNFNSVFFWDLISGEYYYEDVVYVKDKKYMDSVVKNNVVYTYCYFNMSVDVDSIKSIKFSYFKRKVNVIAGFIKDATDWKENIVDIKSDSYNIKSNIFSRLYGFDSNLLNNRITESDKDNYDWKVLVSYDYPTEWYSALIGVLGKVKAEFQDVSVIELSYIKNGNLKSNIIVEDNFPIDFESDFTGLWAEIKDFFKGNIDLIIKILIYLVIGIFGLVLLFILMKFLKFIFKLLISIFSIFKLRKRYNRRKRR
mgnify:CR=1 FL=1